MRQISVIGFIFSLLLVCGLPLAAAPPTAENGLHPGWCGTYEGRIYETLAVHEQNRRRLDRDFIAAREGGKIAALPVSDVATSGDIVVVEDDGRVVLDRNLFDLRSRAIEYRFKKKAKGYKVLRSGAGLNNDFGDRLALGDDASVRVDLPFSIRFYRGRYSRMWVNSDGNVTFGDKDDASTSRDMGRVLAGPPRIAPFFNDMDPSSTSGNSGVFLKVNATSVRVTWRDVPEFGSNNSNTFQVTVFKKGKIQIVFGQLDAETAVVGISPGEGAALDLINLSDDPPTRVKTFAIAETFSDELSIDHASLSQVVVGAIGDHFTHVMVFADFPIRLDGAIAWHLLLRNKIKGIGQPDRDFSATFGSKGTLESYIMMGMLVQYGNNYTKRNFGTLSGVGVGLHEFSHRWLSFAKRRQGGQTFDDMLGRQRAHWSFNLDTDASYMEGNEIVDNGDGTFSTAVRDAVYSPLDLYLMGMVGPEEVPDFFLVDPGQEAAKAPAFDELLVGDRVDVTIQQVVAALKNRKPNHKSSPREFRVAFVLLGRKGEPPSQESIDKVDRFRRQLVAEYEESIGGRAEILTGLDP